MKKTRFIVLVLVVAIMLLGAGYAEWSDVLSVENIIRTGTLDVNFECYRAGSWSPGVETRMQVLSGGDITQDRLAVFIENLYPGAKAYYKVGMQNDGTIPAQLDEVTMERYSTDNMPFCVPLSYEFKWMFGFKVWVPDDNGGHWAPDRRGFACGTGLVELHNALNDRLNGIVLFPGEKLCLDIPEEFMAEAIEFMPDYEGVEDNCIIIKLPCELTEYQDCLLWFSIFFNYTQVNCPPPCR